ncbi:MAG: 5-formyltetrahydrofolate cyclo-ligase [Nitrososphaeria archaeon]
MSNVGEIKQNLREEIWRKMQEYQVTGFPGPFGRIPNFVGAEEAALNLAQSNVWRTSNAMEVNPDAPQAEVRRIALLNGMTLIMPTPRLRSGFLLLDPRKIRRENYRFASTIKGAFLFGRKVKPRNLPHIDMFVVGSVAVDRFGNRIGKGGGYSEIEWAIAREEGKVDESTTVATTVHDVQLVDRIAERCVFDLSIDLIGTPTRIIKVKGISEKPDHIYWNLLSEDKIKDIALLRERKDQG